MTTSTDGAPPSVTPEPDNGSDPPGGGRPRRSERDDSDEAALGTGSSWLRDEIQRRMAESRSRSGGRHARRDSVASPGSAGYVPRHSVATPGPGAPRPGPVGGSPSPHASELLRRERTAAAGPAAWSGPPGRAPEPGAPAAGPPATAPSSLPRRTPGANGSPPAGPPAAFASDTAPAAPAPAPRVPAPSPNRRPRPSAAGAPPGTTGPGPLTAAPDPVAPSAPLGSPAASPSVPAGAPAPAAADHHPEGTESGGTDAGETDPGATGTTVATNGRVPGSPHTAPAATGTAAAASAEAGTTELVMLGPAATAPHAVAEPASADGRPAATANPIRALPGPAWLGPPPGQETAPGTPAPVSYAHYEDYDDDEYPDDLDDLGDGFPDDDHADGESEGSCDPVFTARTPEPGSAERESQVLSGRVRVPQQRGSGQLRGPRPRQTEENEDLQSKRVRVVLAERKGVARPVRTVVDIQEGTGVGEFLRNDLIRTQLSIAIRFAVGAGLTLGLLPLLFAVVPEVGRMEVLGVRLPWLLLGLLVYPFLFGLGLWHSRLAERVEQGFADHVQD